MVDCQVWFKAQFFLTGCCCPSWPEPSQLLMQLAWPVAVAFLLILQCWIPVSHRNRLWFVLLTFFRQSGDFAKCNALAFEQVCNLHCNCTCDTWPWFMIALLELADCGNCFRSSWTIHCDIAFRNWRKKNTAVAFPNFTVLSWSLFQAHKTVAIAFAIRSMFIMFTLASTRHHHSHNCKSVESITIAWAIRGRVKTLRLLFTNFAVSSRSIGKCGDWQKSSRCRLLQCWSQSLLRVTGKRRTW